MNSLCQSGGRPADRRPKSRRATDGAPPRFAKESDIARSRAGNVGFAPRRRLHRRRGAKHRRPALTRNRAWHPCALAPRRRRRGLRQLRSRRCGRSFRGLARFRGGGTSCRARRCRARRRRVVSDRSVHHGSGRPSLQPREAHRSARPGRAAARRRAPDVLSGGCRNSKALGACFRERRFKPIGDRLDLEGRFGVGPGGPAKPVPQGLVRAQPARLD